MRKLGLILLLLFSGLAYAGDPIKDLIKAAGDAATFPNDPMVVVFDSTYVDVQETGLSFVTTHSLTKALTIKGALELSVVKVGYDPLSAYVEIKKVLVHKKDGSTIPIDVSKVMDYPAPARAIYWGAMEKMVEVGRIDPGDAVEVVQFRKGFTYALLMTDEEDSKYIPPMKGQFYDIVEFFSGNPLKLKVYQVAVPKDKPLQYQFYQGDVQSSVWFKGDKMVYGFSKKDILPFKSESRMVALSDVAPKLLLSTTPDWYAKSKWFYKVNEDFGSFESTPEINAKVNEILKGSKNELDSISRLTHWCADEIRYSGISMGCGEGYTLHKGSMTFSDRCGVCKDKAGMLITMLRAAGFQSFAAMTMAGSRIDYIPADQFNHSVTVVKMRDGKYRLLDPTWVPFIRELWSSAEQQQQYLMGLPEGADLATTPISAPENHYLKLKGEATLDKDGTLKGTLILTAEGQTDASVRSGFFRNSNKTQWYANVEKELLKIHPLAEVTKIEYGDPIDYMAGPIKITIEYKIPDYALVTKKKVMFTPLTAAGVFKSLQPHLFFDTGTKEKKYAFRDRCSRMVEINETITIPDDYSVFLIPEKKNKTGDVCSFEGGYTLDGNRLILNEKVLLGKRIYDAKDWQQFREAVNAQFSFLEEPVVFHVK